MFRIFELLSGLDSPQPVVVSLERNKFITKSNLTRTYVSECLIIFKTYYRRLKVAMFWSERPVQVWPYGPE